jgi:hypothetical protein
MTSSSIKMAVGYCTKEHIDESMIRHAQEEFLTRNLSERSHNIIDAILSFMCVSIHRGNFIEQPNVKGNRAHGPTE